MDVGNVVPRYYAWGYGQLGITPAGTTTTQHNCSDFPSQLAAQLYFDMHGGTTTQDVDGLDSHSSGVLGVPCEANPAPYSSQYQAAH